MLTKSVTLLEPSGNELLPGEGCSVSMMGLDKSFGTVHAVRDINLEVKKGEFLTLLGPSGSGKTTLLMMLAGFVAPTSGSVLIDGVDITNLQPYRRNIGMVFQSYALFPHMSVFGNIAFPLQARKIGRAEIERRVARALSIVKLDGLEHRFPGQLSGGQQQRVALARAIVFGPPLLLMDEPLGALDKNLREHMQLELLNIKNQLRKTVVYVTHDQEEALVMSDRVVVMADGRVQQVGTAEEIYERPANRFVAEFIGAANLLDGVIVGQEGDTVHIKTAGGVSVAAKASALTSNRRDVTLVLRPEKVRLGAEARACSNTYCGRIVQAIYLGDSMCLRIAVGDNVIITATRPNILGGREFAAGEAIDVGWEKDQVAVL